MGSGSPSVGRMSAVVLILATAVSWIFVPAAAGQEDAEPSAQSTADLISLASANGALGVFFDAASAVVVLPQQSANTFPRARAEALGLPVRIQVVDVTAPAVANMRSDLLAVRKSSPSVAYAFYFDLLAAKMIVQTDAQPSVFDGISRKYGDNVKIITGASIVLTPNRQADTTPFWGGAKILGGAYGGCSSGFLAKSSTTTYMATAGHCYPINQAVTSGGGSAE